MKTNSAKGPMAHIFNLCAEDSISEEFRRDTFAGAVTDSEIDMAATERSDRGTFA